MIPCRTAASFRCAPQALPSRGSRGNCRFESRLELPSRMGQGVTIARPNPDSQRVPVDAALHPGLYRPSVLLHELSHDGALPSLRSEAGGRRVSDRGPCRSRPDRRHPIEMGNRPGLGANLLSGPLCHWRVSCGGRGLYLLVCEWVGGGSCCRTDPEWGRGRALLRHLLCLPGGDLPPWAPGRGHRRRWDVGVDRGVPGGGAPGGSTSASSCSPGSVFPGSSPPAS